MQLDAVVGATTVNSTLAQETLRGLRIWAFMSTPHSLAPWHDLEQPESE
jgi:hypothetical protein